MAVAVSIEGTTTDLVVVGSGAAGLTGALVAAIGGARVTVLEKTDLVGGTTAISGGGAWVPCNPVMAEVGLEDSREARAHLPARVHRRRRARRTCSRPWSTAGPDMVRVLQDAGIPFQAWPADRRCDRLPGLVARRHARRAHHRGDGHLGLRARRVGRQAAQGPRAAQLREHARVLPPEHASRPPGLGHWRRRWRRRTRRRSTPTGAAPRWSHACSRSASTGGSWCTWTRRPSS